MEQNCEAGYVVVDVWRVKPGKETAIKAVLSRAMTRFRDQPGIVSIDYALVDGHPGRYLVVFRYTDQQARADFVSAEVLTSTMAELAEFWELDDVFVQGPRADLGGSVA